MGDFEGFLGAVPYLIGVSALGFLVIAIGVLFKREWARRELVALRKAYQETDVSDPQYNTVRALYLAARADHDRHAGADKLSTAHDSSGDPGDGGSGGD
ncbi:MAG: hypothetical protein K2Y42_12145 [Hyphomicrobium sp.]|jgi:hypothetical protein|uniref:hypothetical protein n=1 Tax=Hyphomicrobium sp. TaxID=82 RepID=UPI0025BA5A9B|nr:hypothetical protein [Hyphomicrobium sp.]MBX9863490.1 hypothetical protein [Hyphomicrobium sp.]